MDIQAVKNALASDPATAQRCFVCDAVQSYSINGTSGAIRQVFGDSNIARVEPIGKYMVVTLTDASKRDELLANVSRIIHRETCCYIHPVLPLPGRVTLTVTNIPQLIITTYKQDFLQTICEIFPEWENVDVHCVEGDGATEVTAVVPDIPMAKESLRPNKPIQFKGFSGALMYKKAGPVDDKNNFKPEIKNRSVTYIGY